MTSVTEHPDTSVSPLTAWARRDASHHVLFPDLSAPATRAAAFSTAEYAGRLQTQIGQLTGQVLTLTDVLAATDSDLIRITTERDEARAEVAFMKRRYEP